MVRQAHHERNQQLAVRPEPVEGFNQRFPNESYSAEGISVLKLTMTIWSEAPSPFKVLLNFLAVPHLNFSGLSLKTSSLPLRSTASSVSGLVPGSRLRP